MSEAANSPVSLLLRLCHGPARLLPERSTDRRVTETGTDRLVFETGTQGANGAPEADRCSLPILPEVALRAVIEHSGPESETDTGAGQLRGWAVWQADGVPPALICLVDGNGHITPAQRLLRPDIRAVFRLDYDMTGFAVSLPDAAQALGQPPLRLLFLGAGGAVVKPLSLDSSAPS